MTTLLPDSAMSVFFDGTFSRPRLAHPEGVAVHKDGSVWAGTENGDLVRIAPDGSGIEGMGNSGGFLLGIAFDAAGNCYACDMKHAAILRYVAATGAFEHFAASGIAVPNYPVVDDANGWLYVSDSHDFDTPGGGVYRYDLKTGEGGLWTREPMHFANGMALSRDGRGLYVVESTARRVSRVAIEADGSAGAHEVVVEGLDTLPDGILVMENGDLLISNYEPSKIWRYSEAGRLDVLVHDTLATTLAHPTNIALKDGNFVTANFGRWHVSHVDLSGLR